MANASQLRRLNERRVVESMISLRTASQSELAQHAGMSQPTVSRIVESLLARDILAESPDLPDPPHSTPAAAGRGHPKRRPTTRPPTRAPVGRPSTRLQLNPTKPRFLAIQLGVHTTRIAACPLAIPTADTWQAELPTPQHPRQLPAFWKKLAATLRPFKPKSLHTAIISLPGILNESTGQVLLSPNLPWLQSTNLPKHFSKIIPSPLRFTHEIRALALGHLVQPQPHPTPLPPVPSLLATRNSRRPNTRPFGRELPGRPQLATLPPKNFLLVDFGSGVGASAVINGKLYSPPLPLSGEIGHTPILGNTRPCGCGQTGCLETLISRQALQTSAKLHHLPTDWPALIQALNFPPPPHTTSPSTRYSRLTALPPALATRNSRRPTGRPQLATPLAPLPSSLTTNNSQLTTSPQTPWLLEALTATALTIAAALNTLGLSTLILTGFLPQLPPQALTHFHETLQSSTMWARFGHLTILHTPRHRLAGMTSLAIDQIL